MKMGIVDLKDDLEEACAQFGVQSYSGEEMLCGCQRCSGSSVVVGVLGEPHLINIIYENNSI